MKALVHLQCHDHQQTCRPTHAEKWSLNEKYSYKIRASQLLHIFSIRFSLSEIAWRILVPENKVFLLLWALAIVPTYEVRSIRFFGPWQKKGTSLRFRAKKGHTSVNVCCAELKMRRVYFFGPKP